MNDLTLYRPQDDAILKGFTEAARRDWRFRIIAATRGNQSLLGCIVLAALDKEPEHPPYFRGHATITEQGDFICDFVSKDGTYNHDTRISTDEQIARNIVGLTVACNFTDEERIEFLARFNDWIGVDNRSPDRIRQVLVT